LIEKFDLLRIKLILFFLALSIVIPIGVNDAFGAFVNDDICNSLKHIPGNSWKLFLCSTVEINEDAPDITLTNDDRFGDSVANIGDLDGDGVNDLAVGAMRDDAGGTDRGAVYILFMNTDGSVKSTEKIDHTTPNGPTLRNVDRFGDSVANIGDLNGDGINDLAVGAPNDDTKVGGSFSDANWNAGAVHILFLNRDGGLARATAVIHDNSTNGPELATGDNFGHGIANIGDLDGNGYDDLAVGAMLDGTGDSGAVHILFMDEDPGNGLAKATEKIEDDNITPNGPALGDDYWFGGSVANIGDFDGNGVNDLAVGANLSPDGGSVATGAVYILFMDEDPGNGLAKATVVIDHTTPNGPTLSDDDRFGASVVNMGDIDGNGVNDLAVGARGDDEGGSWSGAVHLLFMNTDGSVDSTVEINSSTDKGPTLSAGDAFGTSLANIGDLNGDGINDLVVGASLDDGGGLDRGAVHILFLTYEIEKNGSSECYDCEAPRLVKVQVGITSNKNASDDSMTHVMKEEYAWNFPINAPLSMRDDNITPITANPGDEIEITLDVIDNKSVHLLPTSGIYTNFMERPNNMNLFFANNFDENHNTSTSFYEWNRNYDDVAYDYADSVTWRNPDISYTQFPVTAQTPFGLLNDDLVIEHFVISFKMKFTDSMTPSQIWVSAADYSGQTFKVSLPLTLEILGDEPPDLTSNLNQEVLGYFSEPVLLSMLYQWSETSNEMSELSSILGVNGELPQWTANLATWTVEEKITSAEMIIAIEHVINNS
jgi:hypothetical protein